MAGSALDKLQFHDFYNPALPYFPNSSVTSPAPQFIAGSNILTSAIPQCERRPGFPTYTTDVFPGTPDRWFEWHDWSQNYYVMISVTTSSQSKVYKQKVGTDATFQLILTDSSTGVFDFSVSNNQVFFGNGNSMKKWDGTTVTNWGITAPSVVVTVTPGAGSLSPSVGYQWVICWGNSSTGHISSPSPLGSVSGPQTTKQFVLTGNATTDTQVDQVHIFRTVDGGSVFWEHPSSPISYATWIASGFTDNTVDATPAAPTGVGAYGSQTAPLQHQNDPPTASFQPVYFAGRFWTFKNDTLGFSNYEEQIDGVAVESFSNANTRRFGRQINALVVCGQFLLIYASGAIYRIYGDSLTTFHQDTLAIGKGCTSRTLVWSFGTFGNPGTTQPSLTLVAWLDTSNTVWLTDGQSLTEIGFPIRSDIASIVQSSAAITAHNNGPFHWVVIMDGGAARLRVYDLDTQQWMPPWAIVVSAGTAAMTSIFSGETAAGAFKLFLGSDKIPLAMSPTTYLDNGNTYPASLTLGLSSVVSPGSLQGPAGIAKYGILDHVSLETNSIPAATVSYLTDEDPFTGSFIQTGTAVPSPNRTQGVNLLENWYYARTPAARRVSIAVTWSAASTDFKLYGLYIAYEQI